MPKKLKPRRGKYLTDMFFIEGEPRDCFFNAERACMADQTLRYVEGRLIHRFAVDEKGQPLVCLHGWALTPDDKIVECTISEDQAMDRAYELFGFSRLANWSRSDQT